MPEDTGPSIFPSIRYKDAHAAIDWLNRAFGFETLAAYDTPDGKVAHAELKFGNGALMLGEERDTGSPRDEGKHGLYVYVEDIDAHFERSKAAGAEIVNEIESTDYGARIYFARDVEGNLWSFGTYRPQMWA